MKAHFYSRKGDDGTTGWLGQGRIPKSDLRIETVGSLDECSSLVGTARAVVKTTGAGEVLIQIQRDLYTIMTEISADSENAKRFPRIDQQDVEWHERQITIFSENMTMPSDFILPGDSYPGALVDNARTSVRKAERRASEFIQTGQVKNPAILAFLNRLSSFLFVLEIRENISAGVESTLLAASDKNL
jgi:cob(I)alamin adenosyltransferase